LREITPPLVRSFLADLLARGVGPQAVRRCKAVLQSCLSRAVEEGLVHGNPAQAVRPPKIERKRAGRGIGPRVIERLRASLGIRDATLVSMRTYTGVRPGELLALRWSDIGEHTVLVERSDDNGTIKSTKTGRRRSVRLMAPVRADLQAWRLASGRPAESALVFPSATGGPWHEHDWRNWRRRIFQPAARALRLDLSRPYDLRHAMVSLWLHEGRSVPEVAAWLGHSPTMTLNVYAHVIEELRDSPQISAEEAIRQAREQHVPVSYLSSASGQEA
jgi:integrase